MDFIYLLRVLSKKKWIILGSAVLAALIAYLLTANKPQEYQSTAQVSTGFTVSDEVKVTDNFNFYEAESKFNNALVTFKSPSVMNLVSYDVLLHDLKSKTPFRTPKETTPEKLGIKRDEAIKILENKLVTLSLLNPGNENERKIIQLLKEYNYDQKTFDDKLNVFRFERSDYIQIDFASENPELSAYVVNEVYDQFLNYYKRMRSSTSSQSLDTLQAIMEKRRIAMEEKNTQLKAQGITLNVDDQNMSTFDLIATYDKAITESKARRTELQAELRKVNQRISASPRREQASNPNNDEVVIAREAMNKAFREYKINPTDRLLKARYDEAKEAYNKLVLNNGGSTRPSTRTPVDPEDLAAQKLDLEYDLQAVNQNIGDYQSKINQLRGSITVDASRSAAVQSLIKEAEMASKDFLEAKEKYNNALDISASTAANFKQVLYGQPALEPEPSKRLLLIAMAALAALVTTLLIIIALTYLDSSIKTPLIFKKTVNLKLISMVNFMDLKRKSLASVIARRDHGDDEYEKQRNNVFRESLRKLRFEVETSGKKIFLFTSTKKGQGKTTLIQALSYSLSLSKKKILIIDTNFCNNDLTVQLEAQPILEKMVPYQPGGKSLLEQAKVISKDVAAGSVFAIGSEGGDYTPSEILPRENILKHLHDLTEDFDYIFLEGPPLNDFSDSKELAQYVDGVIAVFSAQHIIKQIDKESISFFRELNGKFIGSILNMVDLKDVNVT